MATLKEKYGGEKGVYYYLFRAIEAKKNELDTKLLITKKDFLTHLWEMGVSLGNFVAVLEQLSEKVEAEEQDGAPFGGDPHYPWPTVYYSEQLKLRWRIEYTKEPDHNFKEIETYDQQFGKVIDITNFNFKELSFSFQDKQLLLDFLRDKFNQIYRNRDMISLVSSTKIAYKDKFKSLSDGEIPYYIIEIGWKNKGVVTLSAIQAESGLKQFNFYKRAKSFREDLDRLFNVPKSHGAMIKINQQAEKVTLNSAYFDLDSRPL